MDEPDLGDGLVKLAHLIGALVTLAMAAQIAWFYLPDRITDQLAADLRGWRGRVAHLRGARQDQAHLMWELEQLAVLCPHKLAAEVDRMAVHGTR
jgi:hypothetical protein